MLHDTLKVDFIGISTMTRIKWYPGNLRMLDIWIWWHQPKNTFHFKELDTVRSWRKRQRPGPWFQTGPRGVTEVIFLFVCLKQKSETPPSRFPQHDTLFCLQSERHIQKKQGYLWVWQRAGDRTQIIVLYRAGVTGGSESLCGCLGDDWQLFNLHANTDIDTWPYRHCSIFYCSFRPPFVLLNKVR